MTCPLPSWATLGVTLAGAPQKGGLWKGTIQLPVYFSFHTHCFLCLQWSACVSFFLPHKGCCHWKGFPLCLHSCYSRLLFCLVEKPSDVSHPHYRALSSYFCSHSSGIWCFFLGIVCVASYEWLLLYHVKNGS